MKKLKEVGYYYKNVDKLRLRLWEFLQINPQSITSLAKKLEMNQRTADTFLKNSATPGSLNILKIYNFLKLQ